MKNCSNQSEKLFKDFSVFFDFVNGHVLSWNVDPTFSKPIAGFTIQSSETPDFSELILNKDVSLDLRGIDDTNFKQGLIDDLRYRVIARLEDGTEIPSQGITFWQTKEDRRKFALAHEIQRKELVRMQKTGEDAWLLKRKSTGQIDWDNIDPVDGTPINYAKTDYGTKYKDGYYNPLGFRWSMESNDERKELVAAGIRNDDVRIYRTVGFPVIQEKDIVVSSINERMIVNGVTPTYFPGTGLLIVQTITVNVLQPTDQVYKIDVPLPQ